VLHILHGTDEFRASEALRALRDSLDTDGTLATNTTTLAGRSLSPQEMIQHAAAPPFLAPVRLVVVEGLLTALGSRKGVVDTWQPFLDFLPMMPDTNHVVLLEPPPKKSDFGRGNAVRGPLFNALKQHPNVTVTEFAELKPYASRGNPSEVAQWLQDRAVRQRISIEPRAIQDLAELMGADLRALSTELQKLWVYTDGRAITSQDVHLLSPVVREERIFDLVDAVVEGHAARGLTILRAMITRETKAPAFIQVMIARQLRQLVRATELVEANASQDEIANATGVRGYPLTKLVRQARATTRQSAEAGLRAAEAADHSVKTGRLQSKDPDVLALELLVVQLAALAPRGRARR